MNKIITFLLLCAVSLTSSSSITPAAAADTEAEAGARPKFYVYNWSNYIDKNVLIDFEARYKVKVVYKTYDSVAQLRETLSKLAFAPDVAEEEIDMVILPAFLLQGLIEQNLLAPVQTTRVRNNRHVFTSLKKHIGQLAQDLGRTKVFALPYLWGTTGIAYDINKLTRRVPRFPRSSWDIIFNPTFAAQFSDCGIVIADRPHQVFQIVRHFLGKGAHSTHAQDLLAAEIVLRRLRPYVDIMTGFEGANALAYGEACIFLGQSPEVFQAQKDSREVAAEMRAAARTKRGRKRAPAQLTYRLPKQGTLLWMDLMVIPVQSKKILLAHKWMDHVLNAENNKLIAATTGFSTPNRRAIKLLPKSQRNSKTLYPTLKKSKIILDRELLDENQLPSDTLRAQEIRAWERFINLRK